MSFVHRLRFSAKKKNNNKFQSPILFCIYTTVLCIIKYEVCHLDQCILIIREIHDCV